MKIQTTAQLKAFSLNGRPLELPDSQTIELEFSAIDTGGGFRDAILDFSISIPKQDRLDLQKPASAHEISVCMQNPDADGREVTFTYQGSLSQGGKDGMQVNGRLKEGELSREVIGFMLHLLR